MLKHAALAALLALAACAAPSPPVADAERLPPLASDAEIDAAAAAPLSDWSRAWNDPFAPFTLMGNIHYVGMAGVSAWLITTPDGHILIDGALPQSGPPIEAHIAELGFDIRDVKIILNSHAHFDHNGGIAYLQRASGAIFVSSAADKPIHEAGRISYGPAATEPYPPIRVDRVIADGETVELGGVALTALITPGHTPGCTSWTMPITGADGAQHTAFFFCSATVAGQSLVPEAYPGMVSDFRATFARLRTIEADVFLANHGNFFGLPEKRAAQIAGNANAFVDPGGLGRLTDELETAFNAELARQQTAPPTAPH